MIIPPVHCFQAGAEALPGCRRQNYRLHRRFLQTAVPQAAALQADLLPGPQPQDWNSRPETLLHLTVLPGSLRYSPSGSAEAPASWLHLSRGQAQEPF